MGASIDTREKLIETALRLFAERGAFNVSLAEVVREAGQRNTSAVHYHFGSRDSLLLAILEPQANSLRSRRREMLTAAATAEGSRPLVEALVRPLVELASEGADSRSWMKIGLELADHRDRLTSEIDEVLERTGGTEMLSHLATRLHAHTDHLWTLRTSICIGFVARAATERAQQLSTGDRPRTILDDDTFVDNLVEMFLSALTAPSPWLVTDNSI